MAEPRIDRQQIEQILSGQQTQQVIFAERAVILGDNHGSVLMNAEPGQQAADRIRPRRKKPCHLPRRTPGFVDREQEHSLAGDALARGEAMDLHGRDGLGKTALISQVMQTQLPRAFPDGLVYLSARRGTYDDLLQDLFEHFYQTGGSVKVNENDVGRYMSGKRALVVVDDANRWAEGDAEALVQALPDCAVLIAGRERQMWQNTGLQLRGLPRQEAAALFERHFGPVPPQDRPTVETICETLADVPLAIVKTAASAVAQGQSLSQVLEAVQPRYPHPDPVGQAFWAIADGLSDEERRVMGAIAAPGGQTVGIDALQAITGLTAEQMGQSLARLQQLGLARANSPRYSLDDGFRTYAAHYWGKEKMRAKAADHYLRQAHTLQGAAPHPDVDNVLGALAFYLQHKQWAQVVYIARQIEGHLVTTGHWGQWRRLLHNAWQAAREVADPASEAWAQNQLGVIAMGLDDSATATAMFRGALVIWLHLGDLEGATIARWNLQIVLGPPPPPGEGKPPAKGDGLSGLVIGAAAIAAILLAVLGGLIVTSIVNGRPTPTPTPRTPPVAPSIELWLATGCGETYAPGLPLEIQAESTVDGIVELAVANPDGDWEYFPEQRVRAGQTTSRRWQAPDGEGTWTLVAVLNDGQDQDSCRLNVEAAIEPQLTVWLDGGCERTYAAGEAFTILYRSNTDGIVDIGWTDPRGGREGLLSAEVSAGQTGEQSWDVPGMGGAWTLAAVLNDGQARDDCPFYVEMPDSEPPPAPRPLAPNDEELECTSDPRQVTFQWTGAKDRSGIDGYSLYIEPVVFETPNRPVPEAIEWGPVSGTSSPIWLECGWTYRWFVRAVDGAGNWSEWSPETGFSLMPGLPDLVIANLETTGPVIYGPETELYPDGTIQVPIRVVVRNQGGGEADVSKVAVFYTGPGFAYDEIATYLIPFTVAGQSNSWFPYTYGPLAAGKEMAFEGLVSFPIQLVEIEVALRAEADSCAADEFMPEHCRVVESDEGNNWTEIPLALY